MRNYEDKNGKIRGIFQLRRLELGENRRIGDFYLSWGELIQIEKSPSFFNRKMKQSHVPHYRIVSLKPVKER